MPASSDPGNPLHDLLREAETELSQRLQEACDAEARGISSESASEIRQLEDSLLSAAMAAAKVLAARRHLDKSGQQEERARTRDTRPDSDDDTSVREFEDESGRRWRAWPVTPNLGRAKEASRRSLGDYQEGWFCFEALDNSGRRRLPQRGRRWSDLAIEELPRLLAEAITVPERKAQTTDLSSGGSPSGLN